jgi:hypothetical protein
VNLGGAGATLTWGASASGFLQDGDALLFGSTQSNARITFQNPLDLSGTGYNAREFRVFDNPNTSNDMATLSGTLSGPLLTDLLKTGDGTLELSAVNSFLGKCDPSGKAPWSCRAVQRCRTAARLCSPMHLACYSG